MFQLLRLTLPKSHSSQSTARVSLAFPRSHDVHFTARVALLCFPGEQYAHVEAPVGELRFTHPVASPIPQSSQLTPVALYVPESHFSHSPPAGSVPGGQSEQLVRVSSENLPLSHLMHELVELCSFSAVPGSVRIFPAGHSSHSGAPVSFW